MKCRKNRKINITIEKHIAIKNSIILIFNLMMRIKNVYKITWIKCEINMYVYLISLIAQFVFIMRVILYFLYFLMRA